MPQLIVRHDGGRITLLPKIYQHAERMWVQSQSASNDIAHIRDCSRTNNQMVEEEHERIFKDGSGKMKINSGKIQINSMFMYVRNDILTTWEKSPKLERDEFVMTKRGKKGKTRAAQDDLFKVNKEVTKISTEMVTAFHNIVVKAISGETSRPDASISIAFLTTRRVRAPRVDDWRKLEHFIGFLKTMADMPLILGSHLLLSTQI